MKQLIGFLVTVLSVVGLVGCLAALIAIWVVRPYALQSSAEILDAADDGLKLVEEKATRADDLVKRIRFRLDPIADKIRNLADKADQFAEDKELKRIEEELAERLDQVDAMAEAAETAVAMLNKSAKLARSLRLPNSRMSADSSSEENSHDSSERLSKLSTKLKDLRANITKIRELKQVGKEMVENVVRVTNEVEEDLKTIDATLQRVNRKATEWQAEVAELRTTIPIWVNWASIIGSVVLAWLGLGQWALARWGWGQFRAKQPA
jgi:methyl-accepting chemotaxis protein